MLTQQSSSWYSSTEQLSNQAASPELVTQQSSPWYSSTEQLSKQAAFLRELLDQQSSQWYSFTEHLSQHCASEYFLPIYYYHLQCVPLSHPTMLQLGCSQICDHRYSAAELLSTCSCALPTFLSALRHMVRLTPSAELLALWCIELPHLLSQVMVHRVASSAQSSCSPSSCLICSAKFLLRHTILYISLGHAIQNPLMAQNS